MASKNTLLLVALSLFMLKVAFAQMNADSLKGAYAGQHWFKWEEDKNWTITTDTEYVTIIDSVNCIVYLNGSFKYGGGQTVLYTNYSFCQGNPPIKFSNSGKPFFYNGDSIKMIADSVPSPPPNSKIGYTRFFGKKIPGSEKWVGVKECSLYSNINISPNPFTNKLNIETTDYKAVDIKIFDIYGKVVYTNTINTEKELELGYLRSGIYLVLVTDSDEKRVCRKFVKE